VEERDGFGQQTRATTRTLQGQVSSRHAGTDRTMAIVQWRYVEKARRRSIRFLFVHICETFVRGNNKVREFSKTKHRFVVTRKLGRAKLEAQQREARLARLAAAKADEETNDDDDDDDARAAVAAVKAAIAREEAEAKKGKTKQKKSSDDDDDDDDDDDGDKKTTKKEKQFGKQKDDDDDDDDADDDDDEDNSSSSSIKETSEERTKRLEREQRWKEMQARIAENERLKKQWDEEEIVE
jgi:hypothetical protein